MTNSVVSDLVLYGFADVPSKGSKVYMGCFKLIIYVDSNMLIFNRFSAFKSDNFGRQ